MSNSIAEKVISRSKHRYQNIKSYPGIRPDLLRTHTHTHTHTHSHIFIYVCVSECVCVFACLKNEFKNKFKTQICVCWPSLLVNPVDGIHCPYRAHKCKIFPVSVKLIVWNWLCLKLISKFVLDYIFSWSQRRLSCFIYIYIYIYIYMCVCVCVCVCVCLCLCLCVLIAWTVSTALGDCQMIPSAPLTLCLCYFNVNMHTLWTIMSNLYIYIYIYISQKHNRFLCQFLCTEETHAINFEQSATLESLRISNVRGFGVFTN